MRGDHARILRFAQDDGARFWFAFRRRLWGGGRKERKDIGPFGLIVGEFAKDLRERGPGAEAALKGASVVVAEMKVGATGRYFAILADGEGPIFEKFAVFEADVQRIGAESRGPDGVVPSREVE